MNKRRFTLGIAAIALATCLGLLDAYWRQRDARSGTRDALLLAMPPEASGVLFADLAELRRAPFAAEFCKWIPKNPADAEYAQFLRETGFDYERDLDRVAIAAIKSEGESKLFALAEGRFDRKKIEGYAALSGTRATSESREILTVPISDSARKISFTFLSKDKVALTNAGDLSALLAQSPNSADAREWRERFTREAGSPVFAVIRQDAAAGSALASRTPGGFQSPQLSAMLDQLQWITLAGKPQDNSLRVVAEGECASDQTTRQLADLLNGVLVLAQAGLSGPKTRQQLDPRIRDAYLELIKGSDVSRFDRGETKSIRLVFEITPKLLEAAAIALPAEPATAVPGSPARKTPAKARAQKAIKN